MTRRVALEIDPDSLTLSDIDTIELSTGMSLMETIEVLEGKRSGRVGAIVRAFLFVQERRSNPDLKPADLDDVVPDLSVGNHADSPT